jgi:uncharacterized YceG family protein
VSDDSGRGHPGGDPFLDSNDPEAVERAERRREREQKRAERAAKRAQKEAAPPPPPPQETPPAPPRTPEQEFWDEPAEPAPPVPGQEPVDLPEADPDAAERGRRRLLRRRKAGGAAAAAGGAAGGAPPADDAPVPPTGDTRRSAPGAPATGERPVAKPAGPPRTAQPIPPQTEAPHRASATTPQADPGPRTADAPRPDPNQPVVRDAVPGEGSASPSPGTGQRRPETPRPDPGRPTGQQAMPPRPMEPTGQRALPPRPMEPTGAGDWEPPPPRDDWFDDHDDGPHDDGDPRMTGAARSGRRHGDDGGRSGGILGALLRHPFRIIGVVVLIVVLFFLGALFQPFHGDGHGRVAVTIPKGSSVGEVGDLLEKKGVISDSTLFQIRVTLAGERSGLFAGKYLMAKDMSYGSAIDELSSEPEPRGRAKPGIVTVTIPEGESRPLTAKLVGEDGIRGNYLKATKKSRYLNPEKYGGKDVKSLEGFLFPDTWEVKTKEPVSYLVRLQLEDFKKKIKKVNMKYANSKNLTIFDVVTIASMVEREAGVPKQRKLVASVIYNRLREGMTLGIDSTIRFATGNYEKPLTQSQLESDSPYNTRTHAGLPPGPINSPGLAAIQAAAHPAETGYLFYVTNPDSCDELTFAKTEEEFLADAAKYEKAREANGGNQPSTCK